MRRPAALAAIGREGFHVDIEGFGKAQQNPRGDRPLVSLEMVEIGPRDTEQIGHLALVQPPLAAQPLEARTKEKLALQHHQSSCQEIHNDTSLNMPR